HASGTNGHADDVHDRRQAVHCPCDWRPGFSGRVHRVQASQLIEKEVATKSIRGTKAFNSVLFVPFVAPHTAMTLIAIAAKAITAAVTQPRNRSMRGLARSPITARLAVRRTT